MKVGFRWALLFPDQNSYGCICRALKGGVGEIVSLINASGGKQDASLLPTPFKQGDFKLKKSFAHTLCDCSLHPPLQNESLRLHFINIHPIQMILLK